jgi:hypothetical protein
MDIHETANAMTLAQRECDDYIEEAMDSGQALFNARSAYLQDKNSWMSRASDIAEKSWVGLGFGLAAVPVALCIAIPAIIGGMILAPIVAAALGIAGAAYGIVDFSRTTASLITKEITPKLGTQPFVKQKPDRLQAFKKFAKKAAPVLLCTVGAAVALAAVVVTAGVAGIILAGAGLGAASVGVGMMVKDKYDERKEIHEIRHKHKIMNEHFEAAFETEASLEKNMLKLQDQLANVVLNSTEESMNLLSGHALTQDDVEQMQGQLQQQEQESIKEKLATQAVASVSKNKIDVETNSEIPKAEEDDEGGSESDKETGKESGDTPILRP